MEHLFMEEKWETETTFPPVSVLFMLVGTINQPFVYLLSSFSFVRNKGRNDIVVSKRQIM